MRDDAPNKLELSVSWHDGSCVLAVAGELDIATVGPLAEAASAALDVSNELIIDLEGVDFADVRGVASLVGSARAADRSGKRLAVRNWPSSMHRIVDVIPNARGLLGDSMDGDGASPLGRRASAARPQ